MIQSSKLIKLKLKKDLLKTIKQGNPWVYNDALVDCPKAPSGSMAKLLDRKNNFLAFGIYDPNSQLSFRTIQLDDKVPKTDLIKDRINNCIYNRKAILATDSSAYRLINGEGDNLAGLVVDVFNDHAALQLDGPGPTGFYDIDEIAKFIFDKLSLKCVYYKARHDQQQDSRLLIGELKENVVSFKEYGAKFYADIVEGQKTGFFLDQRENRFLIRKFSSNKKVLNMFSYTGGFSVNAGLGKAKSVDSVDISKPASNFSNKNWELNNLPAIHNSHAINCFDFIEQAKKNKQKWDLVIVDPPSFAPSKKSVDKAIISYQKIFTESLGLCEHKGMFAASSCSSHISHEMFIEICQNSISKAKKRARVIHIGAQGTDHPFPLALKEMRYLKFILFELF